MFKKSLGGIMSQFTKARDELNKFIAANEVEVAETESKLETLKKDAEQAAVIKENLSQFIPD